MMEARYAYGFRVLHRGPVERMEDAYVGSSGSMGEAVRLAKAAVEELRNGAAEWTVWEADGGPEVAHGGVVYDEERDEYRATE